VGVEISSSLTVDAVIVEGQLRSALAITEGAQVCLSGTCIIQAASCESLTGEQFLQIKRDREVRTEHTWRFYDFFEPLKTDNTGCGIECARFNNLCPSGVSRAVGSEGISEVCDTKDVTGCVGSAD